MKVGDLAITHKGNLCIVVGVHEKSYGRCEWYNIVFCSTGFLRTGYPSEWLRKHKADKK